MCLIVVRGDDGTVAASKRLSWQRGTAKGQKEQSFVPFFKNLHGSTFFDHRHNLFDFDPADSRTARDHSNYTFDEIQ